jgi:peptidoglycan/xylan/chitin deacetylase (PgdA/CDA1 family)
MRRHVSSAVLRAIAALDPGRLAAVFRHALGDRRLALCFHRIAGVRREGELLPKLTVPPAEIDSLIDFLLHAARRNDRWLTVTFDDGYRDSAEYLLAHAPRWPEVEWLYFVCPQKIEMQVGFRWDLAELRRRGDPALDTDSIIFAPIDAGGENLRADLRTLASQPEFAIADLPTCERIQRLPNAELGNHSNLHHRPVLLSPGEFRAEIAESARDFARLFGRARQFAFPFGVPGVDFDATHVAMLREFPGLEIWSTEPRPYRRREREERAVLPRFAVDGTRGWRESVAHITVRSLLSAVPYRSAMEVR